MHKLTLMVGFSAGYVLGTRAGRERYAELQATFRELRGKPPVEQATTAAKQAAAELTRTARSTVQDRIDRLRDARSQASTIDLDRGTTGSSATSAAARLTGAALSDARR